MLRSFAAGTIFGASFGVEPPRVVALHGWGRSHRDFDAVLAPSGSVALDAVALDLPGFGATPPPPIPWDSTDYATAILPILEEIDRPALLVGHSHGGRVALRLADMAPALVAGLVLIGAPVLRPPSRRPRATYRALRWLNRVGVYSDDRLEALRRRQGSDDYRAATGVMRDTLVTVVSESFEGELARLSVPTRLVWGAQDTAVPVALAAQAYELITKGKTGRDVALEIIPDVGHLVPSQAPDSVRRAIEELL